MAALLCPRCGDAVQVDPELSTRELEVLHLLVGELTVKGVACRLGIDYDTCKNHVASIFSKLGVHSRVGAVVLAIRLGLVNFPAER